MTRPPIGYHALRAGRVSEAGRLYFVTKVAQQRVRAEWSATEQQARGPLVQPGVPEIVLGSLDWLQHQELVRLAAYCLMPDHLHVLFQLGEKAALSNVMQRFGSFTGLQVYRQTGSGGLWIQGFHDHALRPETAVLAVATYIEYNPVKAGLVANAEDWPWSSAAKTQPVVPEWP